MLWRETLSWFSHVSTAHTAAPKHFITFTHSYTFMWRSQGIEPLIFHLASNLFYLLTHSRLFVLQNDIKINTIPCLFLKWFARVWPLSLHQSFSLQTSGTEWIGVLISRFIMLFTHVTLTCRPREWVLLRGVNSGPGHWRASASWCSSPHTVRGAVLKNIVSLFTVNT